MSSVDAEEQILKEFENTIADDLKKAEAADEEEEEARAEELTEV